MESKYNTDKLKEEILGIYLDKIYDQFEYKLTRIGDHNSQMLGIDLIAEYGSIEYNIDEKAQLDYLNYDLPTFTFEVSYYKDGRHKEGWLHDGKKLTHYYFLITSIHLNGKDIEDGFSGCKITSVNKKKLIKFLDLKGLSKNRLNELDIAIRNSNQKDNILLQELDPKKEGCLFLTEDKAEKPLNLKLYISNLVRIGVAKEIYP